MKPAFLITIDTEGDNLWSGPGQITTGNSQFLPRFQALCDRFGFQPTYLTDYEMALCPVFSAFARDVLRRRAGEIGAHLHPWNTPPIQPLTSNDNACGPYATEYPPELVSEKLSVLTRLLEDTFQAPMTSHRAGRWGFDGVYARALAAMGYLVDCSVTPGVSWKASLGKPGGEGGPDYTAAPQEPYFVDFDDVRRPGASNLLELPVTIMSLAPPALERLRQTLPERAILRRALNRLYPPRAWLRPDGKNRRRMLRVLAKALQERRTYLEFMLHSSELMPGGSPTFPDQESIEALYRDLEALFAAAVRCCRPSTLTAFAREAWPSARNRGTA
ncbi:MAG: deacetylase [Bryobacteraceae bacterium]|jgi:hypothetical protein